MGTILYHGSEYLIENPQFGKGSLHNDYGRGFYCTENIELAKEWACGKQTNGYANIYELDMSDLKCLNLNRKEYNILNWLAILADNRTYWQNGSIAKETKKYIKDHFLLDISGYDVIIGYRADDSYFSFAQDFVSGLISLQKLSDAPCVNGMILENWESRLFLKAKKHLNSLNLSVMNLLMQRNITSKKPSGNAKPEKSIVAAKKEMQI